MSRSRELEKEIQECLRDQSAGMPSGGSKKFRIELSDGGRTTMTLGRDDYREALRVAGSELLGSGGDLARIYLGNDLVAEGRLQYRRVRGGGGKFSVQFSGEKPNRSSR